MASSSGSNIKCQHGSTEYLKIIVSIPYCNCNRDCNSSNAGVTPSSNDYNGVHSDPSGPYDGSSMNCSGINSSTQYDSVSHATNDLTMLDDTTIVHDLSNCSDDDATLVSDDATLVGDVEFRMDLDITSNSNNYNSTFEEDDSETESLASSVTDYEWVRGRRYHSYHSGQYPFPNDQLEQERLDELHNTIKLLLDDRLFLTPIESDQINVLDIGTGTGLWLMEMSDKYHEGVLKGCDLSPIQPYWVFENVKFLVFDVEEEYVENYYDFIHCRFMGASIKDWPGLIRRIHKALKPGGWVEFQDFSTRYTSRDSPLSPWIPLEEINPEHAYLRLSQALKEACSVTERMFDPTPHLKEWVNECDFTTVNSQVFPTPIGSWPTDKRQKQIGTRMAQNVCDGLSGMTDVLLKDKLGKLDADVELLNAAVRSATQSGSDVMVDYVALWAQKG